MVKSPWPFFALVVGFVLILSHNAFLVPVGFILILAGMYAPFIEDVVEKVSKWRKTRKLRREPKEAFYEEEMQTMEQYHKHPSRDTE